MSRRHDNARVMNIHLADGKDLALPKNGDSADRPSELIRSGAAETAAFFAVIMISELIGAVIGISSRDQMSAASVTVPVMIFAFSAHDSTVQRQR